MNEMEQTLKRLLFYIDIDSADCYDIWNIAVEQLGVSWRWHQDVHVHQCEHKYKLKGAQKKIPLFRLCLFVMIVLPVTQSALVEVPKNKAVWQRGSLEVIDVPCKSDYPGPLKWYVQKNPDSEKEALYNGLYLRPDAKSYCTVIKDEPGKIYLRLNNTADAAQTYFCFEPGTLAEASADLIWIESDPICTKSSTEDDVSLTCRIKFRGNWAPTMEWKEHSSHGEEVISVGVKTVTVPNQHVTSTLVMPMQEDSRSYTCTTKFDTSGKPRNTATNVPDYNRYWTYSALSKSQDQMKSKPVVSTGAILAIVITVVIVGLTAAASTIGICCFIRRRQRREAEEKAKPKENEKIPATGLLEAEA